MNEAPVPDLGTLKILGCSVGLVAVEEDKNVFQAAMEEIRSIRRRGFEILLAFARTGNARLLRYVVAVGGEPNRHHMRAVPMCAGGYVG